MWKMVGLESVDDVIMSRLMRWRQRALASVKKSSQVKQVCKAGLDGRISRASS